MDKFNPDRDRDLHRLQTRLEFLEKENRWYYAALESTASLGDLHRDLNSMEDPGTLFKDSQRYLNRTLNFKTLALYLIDEEDSSFYLYSCTPESETASIKKTTDRLIADGTFAWALKQSRALILDDPTGQSRLLLHPLATRTQILGMVIGTLPPNHNRQTADQSTLISIILQNTAQAMENSLLHKKLQDQNSILESTVKEKTRVLQEQTVELKRRVEELNHFATLASHDLQEPLRKLSMSEDQLRIHCSPQLDSKGQEYLKIMDRSVQQMRSLVDGLSQLSQVTTRTQPLDRVDLNQTFQQVLSEMNKTFKQTGARIQMDPLPNVTGDATQIHQLFFQLISNALKFRTHGSSPEIRVTCPFRADRFVEIRIEDNGIGFHMNHVERIFKPFERLNGKSEYDGVGMGLAICQKIIQRHKGIITAESQPGQGSTFVLILPK